MSRALRYLLVVGGAIVSILLFLLSSASANSDFFDKHYSWLLGMNALVAVALFLLVCLLLGRLYKRYKRGKFGSRLTAKLVFMFALIGILPGVVIYLVSVQFVSRSIESWFDVHVESALQSGLNLSHAALESSLSDLSSRARTLASEWSDLSNSAQATQLGRLNEQNLEASIVTANGQVIASVGGHLGTLVPNLPSPNMLQQARLPRGFSAIESDQDNPAGASASPAATGNETNDLRLHVVVEIPAPLKSSTLQNETHFLQMIQPVPTYLATNAEALGSAYSEYQERSLGRSGLRKIYLVTLTLTLLLAVFGAIASAFLIATDLAKPLLLLAEGTKAVAEGNLSPRPIVATSDELGTLTQSFNLMTRQLYDARATVEKNRSELENAKAYLESVLANMSAGVMVLDGDFRLVTSNQSVARILQYDFSPHIGQPLTIIDGLTHFAEVIINAFSEQNAQFATGKIGPELLHWQQQIEIPRRVDSGASNDSDDITLLARGSRLPVENRTGYVVVFDDISDVISGQRSIAWGEVARRLAHEIKNPLTPIQLSAERLQMKLEDKLMPHDSAILKKSTDTIVNQVAAMKRMVDDFRDYAKTPPAVLSELDLNVLVAEILHLYLAGDERDMIHASLAADLPKIMGDATQLRQVIHNLLQNAQDAVMDRSGDPTPPRIDLVTERVSYQSSDGLSRTAVRLSITDNGSGFSPKILARAFEPYVTSKPRGTGLGLPMVKKIIDEHGGRIDLQNRSDTKGAKILILLLKLASSHDSAII
ncbi:Signal transduction histidine kinase involved in nitrogen fixation and metabolism regulation [Collimonas sp. OK607]|uniref:sensor histidine kinase n=1 Tax=Collimonas sp. OK607 TaxID=1798194 RepID=UPI0008F0E07C|nr:ATP-binding protein [Collimonas sp. OK607]SFB32194.1 Signal transduction histidine kinase involved in nitrogen fixation and metabolism regulation [Collimonas sp. OK607]